jgi:uncharacterized membrane protein (DUF106 family)
VPPLAGQISKGKKEKKKKIKKMKERKRKDKLKRKNSKKKEAKSVLATILPPPFHALAFIAPAVAWLLFRQLCPRSHAPSYLQRV